MNITKSNCVSPRTVLVKIDFVTAMLGKDSDRVFAMVDGTSLGDGALIWVWNIATDPTGKMRSLRFFLKEVTEPETVAGLNLEQVIERMLPVTRSEYHPGQICLLMQIRRPTLALLRKQLGVKHRKTGNYFPRESLVTFFQDRWCGVEAAKKEITA